MRTATCLADRIRPECLFDTTTLTRAGESPRGKESDLRELRYLFPLRLNLPLQSDSVLFCSRWCFFFATQPFRPPRDDAARGRCSATAGGSDAQSAPARGRARSTRRRG